MPDDLERQLQAFGESLAARAGEPIRPSPPTGVRVTGHRPTRRWWALAGAAACLAAVVAGLLVANRGPEDDPVASPVSNSTASTTTPSATIPTVAGPLGGVPADPLRLERDGWTLTRRTTDPFELAVDELPCPASLPKLSGIDQVHDTVTPPDVDGLDVDVQILDVGSLERGNQVAEAIQMIGRCLAEQDDIQVETTGLSSIRATWFRVGSDFALGTVVGEGNLSIVLEIEGQDFSDDLIADLAHRADQFLRGMEVAGVPDDTAMHTTTVVAQDGPFVERGPALGEAQVDPQPGEVKLWVSNQSFDDDPVVIMIRVDGIPVVSEPLFVEGQHNWQSFLIRGLTVGDHTVTAESDTGVTMSWPFTLPAEEARWLVVDYWYHPDDPEGRRFTFDESDQPVVFS